MLFQNGDDSLRLEVVSYELPAGELDTDEKNWLLLRAVWTRDGEVTIDTNGCLLTYELRELAVGLKVLRVGIRDSYESGFMSPYFSLNARTAGEGRFTVAVSFYLPNTMDGDDTAEMECVMDKAELKALIDELDRLSAKFPDRE